LRSGAPTSLVQGFNAGNSRHHLEGSVSIFTSLVSASTTYGFRLLALPHFLPFTSLIRNFDYLPEFSVVYCKYSLSLTCFRLIIHEDEKGKNEEEGAPVSLMQRDGRIVPSLNKKGRKSFGAISLPHAHFIAPVSAVRSACSRHGPQRTKGKTEDWKRSS